jgi:hypothetical protein
MTLFMRKDSYNYPELKLAMEAMQEQPELYRPTVFWDDASSCIVEELCTYGVERFRSLKTALGFFVPTYGVPGGGFTPVQAGALLDRLNVESPQEVKPQFSLNQFLVTRLRWLISESCLQLMIRENCHTCILFLKAKLANPWNISSSTVDVSAALH